MDNPWSKGHLKDRFHSDPNCEYVPATLYEGPTQVLVGLVKNQLNTASGIGLLTGPLFSSLWSGILLFLCLFLGSPARFLEPRVSTKYKEKLSEALIVCFLTGQLLRYNLGGVLMTVSHCCSHWKWVLVSNTHSQVCLGACQQCLLEVLNMTDDNPQ